MNDLNDYRKKIDEIDEQLIGLVGKRMNLAQEIGRFKIQNNIPIESETRENEITARFQNDRYARELKDIYQMIFLTSKRLQKPEYFLVGKSLVYSVSPLIYQLFGLEGYGLWEADAFPKVLGSSFLGISVTNPFKNEAFLKCDETTETAKKTAAVNAIVRRNGRLLGENTDYFGFSWLLDHYHLNVSKKKVLIIGNGATSRTIEQVLKGRNCQEIVKLVRKVRNPGEIPLTEYQKQANADFLINATPYGTFPSPEAEPLFPLSGFSNLQAAIDVIYNPRFSPLLNEARQNKLKAINGLSMLVAQAANSLKFWTGKDVTSKIDEVYSALKRRLANIVLIGMPYSGKTTVGKQLSSLLNKPFFDGDAELEKIGFDLPTVLKTQNVEAFRQKEAEVTSELAKKQGIVLATGGGIVLNSEVMKRLGNNGLIVFVNTPLPLLKERIDGTRPLSKTASELEDLFIQRIMLYHKYADLVVNENDLPKLAEKINEYLDHQWS